MEKRKVVILEKRFYIHPVFTNYATSKDGVIVNLKKMKPFIGFITNSGYLTFAIRLVKEKAKTYTVHRFIWEVIKGPIP